MILKPLFACLKLLNIVGFLRSPLAPGSARERHTLASYPRLAGKLLAGAPLSIRLNIEHIKDGRGLASVLLHRPPNLPELILATGTVVPIAATLLTADETAWMAGRGEAGRRQLLGALYDAEVGYRSMLHRASVVGSAQ